MDDIGIFFFYAIDWVFLCRFWLYYHDWQIHNHNQNKTWRTIIDPINESRNWYVVNRHTWGDEKFLLKWAILAGFLQYCTIAVLWYFTHSTSYYFIQSPLICFYGLLVCSMSIYLMVKIRHDCGIGKDQFKIIT